VAVRACGTTVGPESEQSEGRVPEGEDRPERIYLASPLFNEPQLELRARLANAMTEWGYDVWYAGKDGVQSKDLNKEPEKREAIFQRNVDEVKACDLVVAVLDYKLLESSKLVLRTGYNPNGFFNSICSTQVYLPDSGVVFEMGLAYGCQKPIIGYTEDITKMNVMLSEACVGIATNLDELKLSLACNGMALKWQGEVT